MSVTRKSTPRVSTKPSPKTTKPITHSRAGKAPAAEMVEFKLPQNGLTITRQAIAEAAYFLWLKRGGSDLQNWLDAEAMLQGQIATSSRR